MFYQLTPETLQHFRSLYFTLAPDFTHSALLDSCAWEGKTGGFYMMGFGAQTSIQLLNHQLRINDQFVAEIADRKTLWTWLDALFPHQSRFRSDGAAIGFEDGWIGVLGYELNHLLEPSMPEKAADNPMGQLYFIRFQHVILWSPGQGVFKIRTADSQWEHHVEHLIAENEVFHAPPHEAPFSKAPVSSSMTQAEFEAKVGEIQEHIRLGNLYQANLSMRFEVPDVPAMSMFTLYLELVNRNPSPFSGLFWTPEGIVLSNSPERLVKYTECTNMLEARPIAGTRGRGKTADEELQIAALLQTDEKEQAEHLMLVDLERNDLGRVAAPGTLHVPEVCILERYSHVTHIVSQVEGQKAEGKTGWDILEALFPGGTITGCPKVRCMEILSQIEPVPRGLYTGSMGYLDTRGNLDFNILIRSLFHWPDNHLHFHAGAGIVADSVPAREYRECLRKAEVIQGVLNHDHLGSPT